MLSRQITTRALIHIPATVQRDFLHLGFEGDFLQHKGLSFGVPPQFFLATFNDCEGLHVSVALSVGVPPQFLFANFNDGRSGEAVRPPKGAILDAGWSS